MPQSELVPLYGGALQNTNLMSARQENGSTIELVGENTAYSPS